MMGMLERASDFPAPAGTITATMLADGAVTDTKLAAGGFTRLRSGMYVPAPHTNVSTVTPTLNEHRVAPLPVGRVATLDRIGLEVTTAVATALMRLGIHADNGNGYPGALVFDAGTIDGSTTGFKEIIINQTLAAGLYWLGAVAQIAAATVRSLQGSVLTLATDGSLSTLISGYTQTGVTGALPANFSATVVVSSNIPKLYVRIV